MRMAVEMSSELGLQEAKDVHVQIDENVLHVIKKEVDDVFPFVEHE